MIRRCLRDPIPEIFDAARFLDAAVSAHVQGRYDVAEQLLIWQTCPWYVSGRSRSGEPTAHMCNYDLTLTHLHTLSII